MCAQTSESVFLCVGCVNEIWYDDIQALKISPSRVKVASMTQGPDGTEVVFSISEEEVKKKEPAKEKEEPAKSRWFSPSVPSKTVEKEPTAEVATRDFMDQLIKPNSALKKSDLSAFFKLGVVKGRSSFRYSVIVSCQGTVCCWIIASFNWFFLWKKKRM